MQFRFECGGNILGRARQPHVFARARATAAPPRPLDQLEHRQEITELGTCGMREEIVFDGCL